MIREVLRMEKVTYKEQGRILLDNFNITVRKGEVFGLIRSIVMEWMLFSNCCNKICRFTTDMYIIVSNWSISGRGRITGRTGSVSSATKAVWRRI